MVRLEANMETIMNSNKTIQESSHIVQTSSMRASQQ